LALDEVAGEIVETRIISIVRWAKLAG